MALNIPTRIVAGDSLNWIDSVSIYPADDGWTLHYSVYNAANQYTVTSTPDGVQFEFSVTAAETSAWVSGDYQWSAYVSKGLDRITLKSGSLLIKPDIMNGPVAVSHVARTLAALEAVLEGKATTDQESVSINGRSLTRFSPEELLKWRDRYRTEFRQEQKAEAISNGMGGGSRILVRLR